MGPVSNYTSTINLINPHGFPLRLEIGVTGYTLDDLTSTGRLLIRGPGSNRDPFLDSEAYTAIDTINNRYVVTVPADDPLYSLILEGKPYTWSFTADTDSFRVQGDFKSSYDTGHAPGEPHAALVSVGPIGIEIYFPAGPRGDVGPQGPAGPWSAEVRHATESGAITAADQTVIITASGGTIALTLPTPSSLYTDGEGPTYTITFIRPADDTGDVTLSGTGPDLPDDLYPGEAGQIQSDGLKLYIIW